MHTTVGVAVVVFVDDNAVVLLEDSGDAKNKQKGNELIAPREGCKDDEEEEDRRAG